MAFRELRVSSTKVDFCSNDYLGMVKNNLVRMQTADVESPSSPKHGSSGSRLLSGNYLLIEETEMQLAAFHRAERGLIFNSGYDANLGLLSCIASKEDTIIYDYLSHASIRDGIRLSFAKSFSFIHNDLDDLEKKLKVACGQIFVVTESVFSMDGDIAPLTEISALCEQYHAALIVDEAHATGVIGNRGEGLVQVLGLEKKCFARVHTFGKACGVHGAVVLGSTTLRNFLINFSRAFIYTTSLPPTAVAAINSAYQVFPFLTEERSALTKLVNIFQAADLPFKKMISNTAIQAVIIPGNELVKKIAGNLQEKEFDVRAILYPTVPKGAERLRIVLHAFNTTEELSLLVKTLSRLNITSSG